MGTLTPLWKSMQLTAGLNVCIDMESDRLTMRTVP